MQTRMMMAAVLALGLAPAAAHATCSVSQLVELKVTMNGVQPMVPVTINGREEHFLVDSGAFYSNISSGKAAELGLKLQPLPPNFVVRGIGGEITPSLTTVKSVGLAGIALHDIHFIVGGGEVGNGAGLLGQNVLGIGDVEYDLAHGAVRLMRPHDCKGANPAYWAGAKPVSTVTIEARDEHNTHTIGTVFVNGVKMRAMFDTGANGTTMSLAAAARIGLKPDSPGVRAAGYSRGIGRRTVASYILPIDSIKLGDQEEIRRTHLRAEAGDLLGIDMLIGADFFISHRVYVANGLHRMFFTYDGGPIFNVTPSAHIDDTGATVAIAPDTVAEPTDAAGFARRGAAALARREYAKALADLDKACDMA
uniref:retropepsin-like aspartic protease family protein n=1 Tax=Sphingomonas bacterium TaxID=1895847 RepID=UPI001575D0DE